MNERSLRLWECARHTSMNPNDNKIKCRSACRPSTLHIRRQIINELPIRRQWGRGVVNQNDRLAVHFKCENNLMAIAMCNSSACCFSATLVGKKLHHRTLAAWYISFLNRFVSSRALPKLSRPLTQSMKRTAVSIYGCDWIAPRTNQTLKAFIERDCCTTFPLILHPPCTFSGRTVSYQRSCWNWSYCS